MTQRQVDNYSLDCYRNCPRSYYWRIHRHLVKPGEKKVAAEFGSGVHMGMERYYGGGMSQAAVDTALLDSVAYFAPFESEADDKRTTSKLITILDKYFTRYQHEPFNVVAVEVGGAFELDAQWVYTSRLDLLAEWQVPKGIYIIDHKTTYDIGSLIAKPHNQITGYIYTACEMYENVLGAIVNGIGVYATDEEVDKNVPKVKSNNSNRLVYQKKPREIFVRIPTQRTTLELAEWKAETLHYLHQIEESEERGVWPKHAPDVCTKFHGRCAYLDLCNTDPDTCERMIAGGVYEVKPWVAYKAVGEEGVEE